VTRLEAGLVALVLPVVFASPLGGQTLEGRFTPVDSIGSNESVVVLALDGRRRVVGRVSTDATFRFRLTFPAGGRYSLRVLSLGFAPEEYGPIDVPNVGATRFEAALIRRRVQLQAVRVEAANRCKQDARTGSTWLNIWQPAREQLARVQLVNERADWRAQIVEFRGLEDVATSESQKRAWASRRLADLVPRFVPFQDSFIDVPTNGELESYGIDGDKLAAPAALPIGPQSLATDQFLTENCFGLVNPQADSSDWVGVSFRPVEEHASLPEAVRGVLWVDRISGEIRRLEYQRTGLRQFRYSVCEVFTNRCRRESTGESASGSLDFRRVSADTWIISHWEIRSAPVAVQRRDLDAKVRREGTRLQSCTYGRDCVHLGAMVPQQRVALGAIGTLNGRDIDAPSDSAILALNVLALEKVAGRSRASVWGRVETSLGTPISDAIVRARAPETFARTDSVGVFRIESLRDGRQTLWVEREGFPPQAFTINLPRNSSPRVTFVLLPAKD
jgi:Carboxypeptidase regulatory-like domain